MSTEPVPQRAVPARRFSLPGAGDWLIRGGAMGDAIRAFDWANTHLGPMNTWPPLLRTAVTICVNTAFPMFIWWGTELTNIYNDAYVPLLGARHPHALGQSGRDVWVDVWPAVEQQVRTVLECGESRL